MASRPSSNAAPEAREGAPGHFLVGGCGVGAGSGNRALAGHSERLPTQLPWGEARRYEQDTREVRTGRFVAPRCREASEPSGPGPSGQIPHPKGAYPADFVLDIGAPWSVYRERLRRLEGAMLKEMEG